MLSTGAFGDYVPATASWLFTLVALGWLQSPRFRLLFILTWVLQFSLLGTTPLGEWFPAPLMLSISAIAVVTVAAFLMRAALCGSRKLLQAPQPQGLAAKQDGAWAAGE
jgi:hypothetical protein